jgi:hypothetical protein
MSAENAGVVRHNSDPDEIVRRGQEAWSRLQAGRTWEDWVTVGQAIHIGRHRAMIEANTNRPSGARYDSIFGGWLRQTGFDALDKGARKRLLDCLEHRGEIETWRQTLPSNKRLKLNHPQAVWANWQKAIASAAADQPTPLSPVAKLKQEIIRLEDENVKLRRAGDDLFSSRDTAADIARLVAERLLQRLSPSKVRQVMEHLSQVVVERAELPRDRMKAEPSKRAKNNPEASDIAAKQTAAEATPS